MKLYITILTLFVSLRIFGQDVIFLKTTGKKSLHYLEFSDNNVKVYKMGRYFDKAGTGPSIIQRDTLVFTDQNKFKGRHYTLFKDETNYILTSDDGKEFQTEVEDELRVTTELNNAYYLKSYFDLSDKLNKEFPLFHYSFRNGYYAWDKQPRKTISHDKFIVQTGKEIAMIYDSISRSQTAFTKTTNFITDNVEQEKYFLLKDSISTLPIDYRPQSGYFDKAVYYMAKSNPEYFYKLLQDLPVSKTFIYFAVDQDKELVKQLKQVQGYDDLKKEFLKDYKSGKTMPYRIIATYAFFGGLLTWLIVAQP